MISGKILRDAIISGANNINNQRSRVDELNVFPVPDGDTGTNMGMTIGAAVPELEALADDCTVGEAAKTAASAMLRGARGNSGVITSLLFRGFSKALEGKKEAGAEDLVVALEKGVEAAYKAVMKPTTTCRGWKVRTIRRTKSSGASSAMARVKENTHRESTPYPSINRARSGRVVSIFGALSGQSTARGWGEKVHTRRGMPSASARAFPVISNC